MRTIQLLLTAVVASILSISALAASAEVKPHLTTPLGRIVGLKRLNGSETYYAIPYALPPIGALRWAPPQPAKPWAKALDATWAPDVCLQEGLLSPGLIGAEDCLYLNVFKPDRAHARAKMPVMVWIHGGAFSTGTANDYDGSEIAQRHGMVVVAINYRLGALGFLAHPELISESGDAGNYGILDQQMALKWVKKNIKSFGGDPGNVTIFGQSAGGASVCSQLVSPGARGLFQKAIIESGLCTFRVKDVSLNDAAISGQRFAQQLHCDSPQGQNQGQNHGQNHGQIACLRQLKAEDIANAPSTGIGISGPNSWGTVYGGPSLPLKELDAFNSGAFNQVPVISGTTHDEGRLFALILAYGGKALTPQNYEAMARPSLGPIADQVFQHYPLNAFKSPMYAFSSWLTDWTFSCPAITTNTALSKFVKTYAYEFADEKAPISLTRAEIPDMGAYHASEITYIFQRKWLLADPGAFTPAQKALADKMQEYWVNFASNGNPNAAGLPEWPEYSVEHAIQNLAPAGGQAQLAESQFAETHQCGFWNH